MGRVAARAPVNTSRPALPQRSLPLPLPSMRRRHRCGDNWVRIPAPRSAGTRERSTLPRSPETATAVTAARRCAPCVAVPVDGSYAPEFPAPAWCRCDPGITSRYRSFFFARNPKPEHLAPLPSACTRLATHHDSGVVTFRHEAAPPRRLSPSKKAHYLAWRSDGAVRTASPAACH